MANKKSDTDLIAYTNDEYVFVCCRKDEHELLKTLKDGGFYGVEDENEEVTDVFDREEQARGPGLAFEIRRSVSLKWN